VAKRLRAEFNFMLLAVVYQTYWTTLAKNCVFLEFDGPLYDASSGSKMRPWFLLNTQASVRSDAGQHFLHVAITVLLRGIYRRYEIHKFCSTLFDVYEVIVTNYCKVKGR